MRLLAPAKLNLYLRAGRPRADGYHPLVSWMCTIGLFDELLVDQAQDGELRLICDLPQLPVDAGNLAVRAARALADHLAKCHHEGWRRQAGLRARLHKRIPVGAGLGGGSADGACMLAALNRLWNAGCGRDELSAIAAGLGSDVSFFFYAPSAVIRGRGEVVQQAEPPQPGYAVLLLPEMSLSTAAVYRRFDELGLGSEPDNEPDRRAWSMLEADALMPLLFNDLEPAAFSLAPELGRLRNEAEKALGRPVRMSGSGSALFTLLDGEREAEDCAAKAARALGVRTLAAKLGVPTGWPTTPGGDAGI